MFTGLVYCYINKINNKRYIGLTTKTLEERSGKNGKKYKFKFGEAIKKYGWENFEVVILEKIEMENINELCRLLSEKEAYWINYYDSINNGYNILPEGNISYGWTEEVKKKISKSVKGHSCSEETKRKISQANKGKKHPPVSDETRLKLSLASKRRKNFVSGMSGKKHSEETKQKMRDAAKNRPKWSKESYDKRTATRLEKHNGKYFSEDGLKKIVDSNIKNK